MGVFAPSGPAASITAPGLTVTNPALSNTTLTTANTEYSITLPSNTVRFALRSRDSGKLKLAFVTGTGTTYWSLYPGTVYEETTILATSITIYIQSSKAGDVIEILSWT